MSIVRALKTHLSSLVVGIVVIVLIAIAGAFAIPALLQGQEELPGQHGFFVENEQSIQEEDKLTTLYFVGDMMLTRSVGIKARQNGEPCRWPFLQVADYLKQADITFGNLETTISDRGVNVGSMYSFRSNPCVMEGLTLAGFDALSVANNHIGDWSRVAMEDTFTHLQQNNIAVVGGGFSEEEAYSARILEANGMTFAFLGYTDLGAQYTQARGDVSGIAWLDKERMVENIQAAKQGADVVIVSVHMGVEYETTSRPNQREIARAAIDAGAKLFIGHHPHVVQETEEYRDGFIAYSLGNFVFDQYFSEETMQGMLLEVDMRGDEIVDVRERMVQITREYQTLPPSDE
ncbi:MAG: CapA family protein [Candidatus Spechtbacterales bacterium]